VFAIESVSDRAEAALLCGHGFRTDPKSFINRSIKSLSNLISHLRRSQAVGKQV
jgi:hypothetical protein